MTRLLTTGMELTTGVVVGNGTTANVVTSRVAITAVVNILQVALYELYIFIIGASMRVTIDDVLEASHISSTLVNCFSKFVTRTGIWWSRQLISGSICASREFAEIKVGNASGGSAIGTGGHNNVLSVSRIALVALGNAPATSNCANLERCPFLKFWVWLDSTKDLS